MDWGSKAPQVTIRICCLTLPCGASRGVQGVAMWRCQPWTAAGKGRVVVLCWGGSADRACGRWDESKAWTSCHCGKLCICLKNLYPFFLALMLAWVAVLHWVRSQCEFGRAEASAPAGGLLCGCSHQHLSSAQCLGF